MVPGLQHYADGVSSGRSSPAHKHLFITDVEWLALPPVMLRQFRLWYRGRTPFAYASWATLSDEIEQRVMAGVRRLAPGDWRSGESLWLIDLVAP